MVLPLRRLLTGGHVFLISKPEKETHFSAKHFYLQYFQVFNELSAAARMHQGYRVLRTQQNLLDNRHAGLCRVRLDLPSWFWWRLQIWWRLSVLDWTGNTGIHQQPQVGLHESVWWKKKDCFLKSANLFQNAPSWFQGCWFNFNLTTIIKGWIVPVFMDRGAAGKL